MIEDRAREGRARRSLPRPVMRRALREQVDLSQDHLARDLGVDRSTVSRWESGRRTPRGPLAITYLNMLERLQRMAEGEGNDV